MFRFGKRKKREYPRKRRIPEYEAELFLAMVYAKYRVPSYELKAAIIKHGASSVSKEWWGTFVEVLFYTPIRCEVRFLSTERGNQKKYIVPTNELEFIPSFQDIAFEGLWKKELEEGEYVKLLQDIISDDEEKEVLGIKGEKCLLFRIVPSSEFPLWLYHEKKEKYFCVHYHEIERCYERLSIEVI